MVDHMAIDAETSRIDIEYSFEKEFIVLTPYESLKGFICNCLLDQFISKLYLWSYN